MRIGEHSIEIASAIPRGEWESALDDSERSALGDFVVSIPAAIPDTAVPFWSSVPTRQAVEGRSSLAHAYFGGTVSARYLVRCVSADGFLPCHEDAHAYDVRFDPNEGVSLPVHIPPTEADFVGMIFAYAEDTRRPFPVTHVRVFAEEPMIPPSGIADSAIAGLEDGCSPEGAVFDEDSGLSEDSFFIRSFGSGDQLRMSVRTCEVAPHRLAFFVVGLDRPVAAMVNDNHLDLAGNGSRAAHAEFSVVLPNLETGSYSVLAVIRTADRTGAFASQGVRIG